MAKENPVSSEPSGDNGVAPPKPTGGIGGKKLLALVVVAALLIAVPLGYMVLQSSDSDDSGGVSVTVVGKDGEETDVSLEELQDMDALENITSYQNRFGNWNGYGTYVGAELCDLADLAGGMNPGDIMTVSASDGYQQNLSYYQVYAEGDCLEVQGRVILAYSFNGTLAPDWADGPMIAVLAPDNAFSNDDFNNTCAKDPEFLSSTSAGSLWVRNVERIQITACYEEWTVMLTDLEGGTHPMSRTKFVALTYFYGEEYVDGDSQNWSGVPVEAVLGLYDDDDPVTYNSTLADESQYRVTVEATDGYARTLVACELVDIGAMFAIEMNGSALDEETAPVRLVGPDMSGKNMVSMIANITMDHIAVTVTGNNLTVNLTVSELARMDDLFSGSGCFMRSTGTIVGPLNFTGVPVKYLVDEVHEGDNYSLNVVAWDNYGMSYSPAQVENGTFPTYEMDGTLIGPQDLTLMLAFEDNGVRLPYDGLRIVIVDDEGAPVTDGHLWAKMPRYLNVVPFIEEWTLQLDGVTSMEMDRQTFESLASCYYHTMTYEFSDDDGNHVYEGVPLWVLVSAVDGADAPDGHYMFNDALADGGYTINVTATDGRSGYFEAEQVARNDSILVVYKLDGDVLPEDEWPLRIVGEDLPGAQKIKMIASIAMEDFEEIPAWDLSLVGLTEAVMTEWDMVSLFNCDEGLHVSYFNFTEDTVEHSYAGIPLWVLIGMVDGGDDGHWLFNDTLAALGYSVNVSAVDFSTVIPIEDIAYNDDLIVALMFDGEYLTDDDYPLKLVGEIDGEEISGMMKVKAIVQIALVDLPE